MAEEALAASQKEDRPAYVARSWMILGEIQHIKGENEKALLLFNKAHELAERTGFDPGMG